MFDYPRLWVVAFVICALCAGGLVRMAYLPALPPGLHYHPLQAFLPRGWWTRLDDPPADPESLGIAVRTSASRDARMIVLAAEDGRVLEGAVIGYWAPKNGRTWHYRGDRRIKAGATQIMARLLYPYQRYEVRDLSGNIVPLRIVDSPRKEEASQMYPNAHSL